MIYNTVKVQDFLFSDYREIGLNLICQIKISLIGICFYCFYVTLKFFYNHSDLKKDGSPKGWNRMETQYKDGTPQEWAGASSYQLTRARVLFLLWSSHLCFHAQALSLWANLSVTVLAWNMEQLMGWSEILWRNLCSYVGKVSGAKRQNDTYQMAWQGKGRDCHQYQVRAVTLEKSPKEELCL